MHTATLQALRPGPGEGKGLGGWASPLCIISCCFPGPHSLGRPTPEQCPPHFPSLAGSARRTSSIWLCSSARGTLPFHLPCLPGDARVASRSAPGDPVRASCLGSSSTEHQPLGLSPGAHTLCFVVLSWHVSKRGAEPLLLIFVSPEQKVCGPWKSLG